MSPNNIIHDNILLSVKEGDMEAYAQVYRHFYPALFNYGKKFTGSVEMVEDCIQEIFTQFWIGRAKLANVKELRSYLFVSFRNRLLKAIEQERLLFGEVQDETNYSFELQLSADQVMIDKERMYERRVNLRTAIDKLTVRQREAIFLRFYETMSYEEISSILSISTKATYKLVARAISELRAIYSEQQGKVLLNLFPFLFFLQ